MKTRLIVIVTVVLFLGYPSCRCPSFYLMSGIGRCLFYDPGSQISFEGGQITTDSLHVRLLIKIEEYVDAGFSGLMSEADAYTQCATPLVNAIQSISFTSNEDFNEINAGELLNAKIRSIEYNTPLDSLPFVLIEETFDFELRFLFTEKPDRTDHTFSITIVDNAGNTFLFQAQPLTWL